MYSNLLMFLSSVMSSRNDLYKPARWSIKAISMGVSETSTGTQGQIAERDSDQGSCFKCEHTRHGMSIRFNYPVSVYVCIMGYSNMQCKKKKHIFLKSVQCLPSFTLRM